MAHQAGYFALQVYACLVAEAEFPDILVDLLLAEHHRGLDGPDIGRFLYDLAEGEHSMVMVVLDSPSSDLDRTATAVNSCFGFNGLLLKRRYSDYYFKG